MDLNDMSVMREENKSTDQDFEMWLKLNCLERTKQYVNGWNETG
jgi:hypothetical protein